MIFIRILDDQIISIRHLQDLLVKLGYRVEVVENRTAEDMFAALKHFSRQSRHKDYPSTVVAVLSHGMNECIYGADGRSIPLNQIISLFDNTACPALQNKPKLFLFQCCRGSKFFIEKMTVFLTKFGP